MSRVTSAGGTHRMSRVTSAGGTHRMSRVNQQLSLIRSLNFAQHKFKL